MAEEPGHHKAQSCRRRNHPDAVPKDRCARPIYFNRTGMKRRHPCVLPSGCFWCARYSVPRFELARTGTGGEDVVWSASGHDAAGTRYSPLKQIHRGNVTKLRVAWIIHTGALDIDTELKKKAAFEATPIMVDGRLYLTTPFNQVLA